MKTIKIYVSKYIIEKTYVQQETHATLQNTLKNQKVLEYYVLSKRECNDTVSKIRN